MLVAHGPDAIFFEDGIIGKVMLPAVVAPTLAFVVGGAAILMLYRIVGRGAGSGVPVSGEFAILWQLRDGKLLKGQVYLDQRQALEAAGLPD